MNQVFAFESPVGPAVVTIKPTDKYFFSEYCPPWTADLSSLHPPLNPFGSGTLIVGVDVAPGTWRTGCSLGCAPIGHSCYWARLRGFSSGGDVFSPDRADVIESGGGQLYDLNVVIQPTDKGFTSNLCGVWEKVG